MKYSQFGLVVLLASISEQILADTGIGDVAKTLSVSGNILTKVMWAACIIVGIALIAASFTQFQIHRRNPKLVPLTTPVMYLILGICAIAIPFLNPLEGFMGAAPTAGIEHSAAPANGGHVADPNDIDAPIN